MSTVRRERLGSLRDDLLEADLSWVCNGNPNHQFIKFHDESETYQMTGNQKRQLSKIEIRQLESGECPVCVPAQPDGFIGLLRRIFGRN